MRKQRYHWLNKLTKGQLIETIVSAEEELVDMAGKVDLLEKQNSFKRGALVRADAQVDLLEKKVSDADRRLHWVRAMAGGLTIEQIVAVVQSGTEESDGTPIQDEIRDEHG